MAHRSAHHPRTPRLRTWQRHRTRTFTRAVTFIVAALVVATGAAAPASAATDAEPQAAAGQEVTAVSAAPDAVIALGDSYSSGLGAGDYQDDCDRTPRAWGNIIFGEAVTDRTCRACSGAQIPAVRVQIEQLAEPPGQSGGRRLTLTVGGNDVGFPDERIDCRPPFGSCVDREAVITQRIDALHDPLVDVYTSIQAAAPGDEVIVGGYPMLVPDPAVRSDCAALTGLLSTAERQMIRRLGVALNDAIDAAASAAGVRSAATELEQGFDGHEACANGADDWLYGL